jgi:uncharacterized cofD-like protein
MPKNIACIGGWAGTFNVLYGLKENPDLSLSAIISVADDGGTAGLIRDKYGILPPGDFRRAIAALAKDTGLVRQLFEYSFKHEEWVIGKNKIGNILLTALVDIYGGDFEKAIDILALMFDVRGEIIPVTLEDVKLAVRFEDGTEIIGEKYIDISDKNDFERTHNIDQDITDAWLVGNPGTLNPRAKKAILEADTIVIGPGDLYTSIVPNLLSLGMREALHETKAKIIYVCNAMTKRGETTNMEVIDFIDVIEKYIDPGKLDAVIVNNGHIAEDIVAKYKAEENKKPVKIKDHSIFTRKSYQVIEYDIVNDADVVRHDPIKLAKVLQSIISISD